MHEDKQKQRKRIELLEKVLGQALNYLGLVTATSNDKFDKAVIHQFIERGRAIIK